MFTDPSKKRASNSLKDVAGEQACRFFFRARQEPVGRLLKMIRYVKKL